VGSRSGRIVAFDLIFASRAGEFAPAKAGALERNAMTRNAIIFTVVIWIISTSIIGWAESPVTVVRVLDASQVEGIAGAVVLINLGSPQDSKAFAADKNGIAYISDLNCSTCVITAIDPRGLFFSKTTEFDRQSSSVTLILQLRPVIDKLGEPGAIFVNIAIHDQSGAAMVNRDIVVRPREMTLTPESNRFYKFTTDSKGQNKARLIPGDYSVAMLVDGKVLEAPSSIAVERSRRCADVEKKRLRAGGSDALKKSIAVQLV
jgi:hypothetical protein